ncbi:MAG: 50S ribosomal protein L20 [Candidatus Levybacteria bacterium]|nr:50S ribosomal protein L20 [Candidatus Levybacteria bacterium]
MAHVKRGMVSRRKHKKILELAKGYRGTRGRAQRKAHEAILHSGAYAFHGRKLKKRNFRALWNIRIGEMARQNGLPYNIFMNKLKKSSIELDRKILAEIAVNDPATFKFIVEQVRLA